MGDTMRIKSSHYIKSQSPHIYKLSLNLFELALKKKKKNRPEVRGYSHNYGKLRSNWQEGIIKEAGIIILDRSWLPLTCLVYLGNFQDPLKPLHLPLTVLPLLRS